jgi:lipopolysaccharide export system protein LptA
MLVAGATWIAVASGHAADFASLDENAPLSVEASQGIEWRREEGVFIARGDARAEQGETEIRGETLTARYRETPTGGNRIYRFEAEGDVRASNGDTRLFGQTAVYDLDEALFTVSGGEVRLETPDETIVAQQGMEFRNRERIAVARGDVILIRDGRRLRSDRMTAHFSEQAGGGLRVSRIEANGGVLIATAKEVVRADKAVYHPEREVIELDGAVRVTRGRTELAGARAFLDLRSGVSRLDAGGGAGGAGRARALFVPESRGR